MRALLIQALIDWGKSPQIELTNDLKASVNTYFEASGANKGRTKEDKTERKKIIAKELIIQALYALDKPEVSKLEAALIELSID